MLTVLRGSQFYFYLNKTRTILYIGNCRFFKLFTSRYFVDDNFYSVQKTYNMWVKNKMATAVLSISFKRRTDEKYFVPYTYQVQRYEDFKNSLSMHVQS